jgi:hypothetical protein
LQGDCMGLEMDQADKRTILSSPSRLLYLSCKGDCMGYLIDQADKSTSNYQAFLDFCTRVVRGIA